MKFHALMHFKFGLLWSLHLISGLHGLEGLIGEEEIYTATDCESFSPQMMVFLGLTGIEPESNEAVVVMDLIDFLLGQKILL